MAENSSSPESINAALSKVLATATALANAGKSVDVRTNSSDEARNNTLPDSPNEALLAQIRTLQDTLGQLERGSLAQAPNTDNGPVTALRSPARISQQQPTNVLPEDPISTATDSQSITATSPGTTPASTTSTKDLTALKTKLVELKKQLVIKEKVLAVDKKVGSNVNAVYIKRVKSEVAALKRNIADVEVSIAGATNTAAPAPVTVPPTTPPSIAAASPFALDPQQQALANQAKLTAAENVSIAAAVTNNTAAGVVQATNSNKETKLVPFAVAPDWRVRVSLAPGAKYFYNAKDAGILEPLRDTKGVIFPYMPKINVTYSASYSDAAVAHSNYKIHNYSGSSVDNVTITGVFTAQDDNEALYVLAVMHFFRSATKMFYGKDGGGTNPPRGTPPPLVYLTGLGAYQFDNHPMVIQSFQLDLPDDVDYINAGGLYGGMNLANYNKPSSNSGQTFQDDRLFTSNLEGGGGASKPNWRNNMSNLNSGLGVITRIPTKMNMTITCLPIVTRNAISNNFSLAAYAKGDLLRGSEKSNIGGGIW